MALKPDRKYTDGTDISMFCNNVTERGMVAIAVSGGGSGAAMDSAAAYIVTTGVTTSGVAVQPMGIVLNDMVNYDLTRQHINWYVDEVQLGGKVTLLRHGYVVTNVLDTGCSPYMGAPAYVTSQNFTGSKVPSPGGSASYTNAFVLTTITPDTGTTTGNKRVGTFLSQKDADGYAKVEINVL